MMKLCDRIERRKKIFGDIKKKGDVIIKEW